MAASDGEGAKYRRYLANAAASGIRMLAGSALARKSCHISDRRKFRANLFASFDGEGRLSSAVHPLTTQRMTFDPC